MYCKANKYLCNFSFIILLLISITACFKKSGTEKSEEYVVIKNTLSANENRSLLQPFIDGAWVSVNYLQKLHEKGLPSLVSAAESSISTIIIPEKLLADTVQILLGSEFNKVDTANLTFHKNGYTFLPTMQTISYDGKWLILYKIAQRDTFLVLNKYNPQGQLIESTRFFKIRNLMQGDILTVQNVQLAVNRIFLAGTYTPVCQNCGFDATMQLNIDGTVVGHHMYKYFTLLPGKQPNSDYLLFWNDKIVDKFELSIDGQVLKMKHIHTGATAKLARQYDIYRSSEMFDPEVIDLSIEDKPELVEIKFSVNDKAGSDSKTDSLYRKLINAGYFNYKLYYNDRLLVADYQFNKLFLGEMFTQHGFLYFTELGRKRIAPIHKTAITLPKMLFRNVPAGRQKFKLFIYQQEFNRAIEETRRANIEKVLINKSLPFIWAEIQFEIDIPPIYMQTLKVLSFESTSTLKVDFNLAGQKGTADMFWQVLYPQFNGVYYRSPLMRNVRAYDKPGEVRLYFTDNTQEVNIMLMDYDGKNQSEKISVWSGAINKLGTQDPDVWKTLQMNNNIKITYSISLPQLVNSPESQLIN